MSIDTNQWSPHPSPPDKGFRDHGYDNQPSPPILKEETMSGVI